MVGDNKGRLTRHTSYSMNLAPQRSSTDIRRNFFSNRAVTVWNSLPTETKDSQPSNQDWRMDLISIHPVCLEQCDLCTVELSLFGNNTGSSMTSTTFALWTKRHSANKSIIKISAREILVGGVDSLNQYIHPHGGSGLSEG